MEIVMAVRGLDADRRSPRRRDPTDILAPARGILIGLALSAILWALLAALATRG
jgi:hypothetical protein